MGALAIVVSASCQRREPKSTNKKMPANYTGERSLLTLSTPPKREEEMNLRHDIQLGLDYAFSDGTEEPPVLDQHGVLVYHANAPDLLERPVPIGLRLGGGDRSFILSCMVARLKEPPPIDSAIALLELNGSTNAAGGACFALDEATNGLVLALHWPVDRIQADVFSQVFWMFCVQAIQWIVKFRDQDLKEDPRLSLLLRKPE